MLRIIVNNKEIDLGKLKGITLKLNPGLFENDSFIGAFTVPFNIPDSDINNEIFEYPYKLSNANKDQRIYPAELWHSGIRIKEGSIIGHRFAKKHISCKLYLDNGNLFKDFNEKLLNENDFGGEKPFVLKSEYDYLTDDFVIYQVMNKNFFKDTVAYDELNNWGNNQNLYWNAYYNYWPTNTPMAITPFPLLWRMLPALFQNKGFSYTDNFFSQGNYRRINIFNTNNAVKNTFVENDPNKFPDNVLSTYNIANHLPEMPTSEFIRAIQSFFNIKFLVRDYQVKVIDRLELIKSTDYEDLTNFIVGDFIKTATGVSYDGVSFNVQRDSNDENVSGIPDVSELENIVDKISRNQIYENPQPYLTAHSIYSYQVVGYSVFQNKADYQGNTDHEWLWGPYPYEYWDSRGGEYGKQQGYFRGKREYEINGAITPISMVEYAKASIQGTPRYPQVLQKGNSSYSRKKTPFSLRLMMYQGLITFDDILNPGNQLQEPFADDHFYDNGDVIGMHSTWSYKERWEEYIRWDKKAQKEDYQQNIQLSASQIKNFEFAQKKLISGNLFFIKNMDVQLLRTSINPAKCTMIKTF